MKNTISQNDIEEIQKAWGDSLIQIGKFYLENKDYKKEAQKHVEHFYGYQESEVLFKPTRAARIQFRDTFESAVSYFIGKNPDFPEDKGFALQPWIKVRFQNSGFILNEKYAFVMGNYFFTGSNGKEKKVEYTLGFFISKNGQLKINVHHSSLPFN